MSRLMDRIYFYCQVINASSSINLNMMKSYCCMIETCDTPGLWLSEGLWRPSRTTTRLWLWLCVSFRVHPAVRNRGGSQGAGGGRRELLLRELHVRLFRGRGPGHGVVVGGACPSYFPGPSPFSQQTRLLFSWRRSALYSYLNKKIFLQWHKDFYCCKGEKKKICSGMS